MQRVPSQRDPVATVVVVTWQGANLLASCLGALREQTVPYRLLVVDNASTDGTAALLAAGYPEAEVIRTAENLGFAGGAEVGLAQVRTPYAVLLNDDAMPERGWLAALIAALDTDPQAGAVASKVLLTGSSPETINSAGGAVTRDGYGYDRGWQEPDDGRYEEGGEVFVAPGTAVALRRTAVAAVGGIPVEYFLYYEDTDLSWRLWLGGWTVRYEPRAVVRHLHSATVGRESSLHQFHDARNRLLTLVRNATWRLAAEQVLRFPLTTGSLALRSARVAANERPRLRGLVYQRVLAYLSFLRLLPWAVRERRRLRPLVPRREVERLLIARGSLGWPP